MPDKGKSSTFVEYSESDRLDHIKTPEWGIRKDFKLNSIKKSTCRKLISAEDKKRSDPDTSKNYVQSFAGDNDKKLSEFDVSFGKQDLLKRQNLEFMRSKQCYAYEDMN
jgi:hypothetical protein